MGDHTRRHADERGNDVVVQRNAREAKHVVEIKGKERNQPHEGDETPALRVGAIDHSLEEPAGIACNPVSRDVARNEKCKGGTERGRR
jgi:hypothetical protein